MDVLREHAARHGADREAERADRGPDPDRLPALLLGERGRDDREGRGREQRGADSLQGPGGDEQGLASREAREQRRRGEDGEPEQEHPLPAEQVAEPAAGEQERREGEDVPVHDPLERALAEAEVAADRREGDVDHRVVDRGHEDGEGDGDERPPLPGRVEGLHGEAPLVYTL